MDLVSIVLIIMGLFIFELANSIDNAIINANVLATMKPASKKWFTGYGLIISVIIVRGLLPWLLIWLLVPALNPIAVLTATFTSNSTVGAALAQNSPLLLAASATFLLMIFLRWVLLEREANTRKAHASPDRGQLLYLLAIPIALASVSLFFAGLIDLSLGLSIGLIVFLLIHLVRQNMELSLKKGKSEKKKIIYVELMDSAFSLDGVLGAFAFTLSVPLIIIGNGLGAIMVRLFTTRNSNKIRSLAYLKTGAMCSIFALSMIMFLEGISVNIPVFAPPLITVAIIGSFFVARNRL